MSVPSGPRSGTASVPISVSAGTTALVTGVSGKKVKVYSYAVVASGAGTVQFKSNGGSAITGAMSFAANGGISCASGSDPWFATSLSAGLDIVTSGAVEGHITYVIE